MLEMETGIKGPDEALSVCCKVQLVTCSVIVYLLTTCVSLNLQALGPTDDATYAIMLRSIVAVESRVPT